MSDDGNRPSAGETIRALRVAGAGLTDADLAESYRPDDRSRSCVRVNFVTSLDGAVSLDGYSAGLSGVADKRVFGWLRGLCDALLVGAGTVKHEGYRALRLDDQRREWRLRNGLTEVPTLVIVTDRLSIGPDHPALADAPVRPVVLTRGDAPADRRAALSSVADVLACGTSTVDLAAALDQLADRGLRQILCEGGPHLLGALTAADLVDELCLTVSPLLAGPGPGRITDGVHTPQPRRMRLRHALAADEGLLLRYTRDEPRHAP